MRGDGRTWRRSCAKTRNSSFDSCTPPDSGIRRNTVRQPPADPPPAWRSEVDTHMVSLRTDSSKQQQQQLHHPASPSSPSPATHHVLFSLPSEAENRVGGGGEGVRRGRKKKRERDELASARHRSGCLPSFLPPSCSYLTERRQIAS